MQNLCFDDVVLPSYLSRNRCVLKIVWVWRFKINYLKMRRLYRTLDALKFDLNLINSVWWYSDAYQKKFLKRNIINSIKSWHKEVTQYVERFPKYLNGIRNSMEEQHNIRKMRNELLWKFFDDELRTIWRFPLCKLKNGKWETIMFDEQNLPKCHHTHNLIKKYKENCSEEIKTLYKGNKKEELLKFCFKNLFIGKVTELLSACAILNKKDKKLWEMLLREMSKEMWRVYNVKKFDEMFRFGSWEESFKADRREEYYFWEGSLDEYVYKKDRDTCRVEILKALWKWIDMVEENTWILCCAIDGSWEIIDLPEIKKQKGNVKDWLYVYTNWRWWVVDKLSFNRRPDICRRMWIMSMSVFDGSNQNLKSKCWNDIKTYRLDRAIPENFLFED